LDSAGRDEVGFDGFVAGLVPAESPAELGVAGFTAERAEALKEG